MPDEEKEYRQTFRARFRPTGSRLKDICVLGRELLEKAGEEKLDKFTECDERDGSKVSFEETSHEKLS